MEIWLKDAVTGAECGLTDGNELFLVYEDMGYTAKDTLENRKTIIKDFCQYTGRQHPILAMNGRPICSNYDLTM